MVFGLGRRAKVARKGSPEISEGFVRYCPVFIDERTRKESNPGNSNLFTKEFGLAPKTGDYMEMGRGCFAGSGTYFVPVRQLPGQLYRNDNKVSFVLDMVDSWGCSPIGNGRAYDDFREFGLGEGEVSDLKGENVPDRCKIVLVDGDFSVRYEETGVFEQGKGKTGLYNFFPGKVPFFETFYPEDKFSFACGVPGDDLRVRAVLHPLYGLPKVLLQER